MGNFKNSEFNKITEPAHKERKNITLESRTNFSEILNNVETNIEALFKIEALFLNTFKNNNNKELLNNFTAYTENRIATVIHMKIDDTLNDPNFRNKIRQFAHVYNNAIYPIYGNVSCCPNEELNKKMAEEIESFQRTLKLLTGCFTDDTTISSEYLNKNMTIHLQLLWKQFNISINEIANKITGNHSSESILNAKLKILSVKLKDHIIRIKSILENTHNQSYYDLTEFLSIDDWNTSIKTMLILINHNEIFNEIKNYSPEDDFFQNSKEIKKKIIPEEFILSIKS